MILHNIEGMLTPLWILRNCFSEQTFLSQFVLDVVLVHYQIIK